MLKLKLPVPPSTNELFVFLNKNRRIPSKQYTAWRIFAALMLNGQPKIRFENWAEISICVPVNYRRDLDNYLKAPLDLLVGHGILSDDRIVQSLTVERWEEMPKDEIEVTISGCEKAWLGPKEGPGRTKKTRRAPDSAKRGRVKSRGDDSA